MELKKAAPGSSEAETERKQSVLTSLNVDAHWGSSSSRGKVHSLAKWSAPSYYQEDDLLSG